MAFTSPAQSSQDGDLRAMPNVVARRTDHELLHARTAVHGAIQVGIVKQSHGFALTTMGVLELREFLGKRLCGRVIACTLRAEEFAQLF